MPAHVTILFPFADPTTSTRTALAELLRALPPRSTSCSTASSGSRTGAVWLHPEPSLPFVDLIAAVEQRWPDYPPYEGIHDEVIPHLTVSDTPVDVYVELPIAARAREVVLIEEDEATERWSRRRAFPLGG